jgi:hypothetical protein
MHCTGRTFRGVETRGIRPQGARRRQARPVVLENCSGSRVKRETLHFRALSEQLGLVAEAGRGAFDDKGFFKSRPVLVVVNYQPNKWESATVLYCQAYKDSPMKDWLAPVASLAH